MRGCLRIWGNMKHPWAHGRRRYDAGIGVQSRDNLELVTGFFEARMGQLYRFRWNDWADFRSGPRNRVPAAGDQVIAVGDGVMTALQLVKTYTSGPSNYVRPIVKPIENTIRVAVNAVELFADFTVDANTGWVILELLSGGATVHAAVCNPSDTKKRSFTTDALAH